MEIWNARYERTAINAEQYPEHHLPEIAFVGRSNCGKSSIINSLVNQKNMAYVGSTPGKTRQINFYNIGNQLYLVDLPGYGYAKVSKNQKITWDDMIESYLNTRAQLNFIIMLVDIRHQPSKQDQLMCQWLLCRKMPFLVVASKADKIPRSQINNRLLEIQSVLRIFKEPVAFSAKTGQGIEEIWNQIRANID